MPIREIIATRGVPVHVFTDEIDPKARQQLVDLAESGIVWGFVAAMPDVHYGAGATVGSVFASEHAVCPNAVGVDIGCGMAAMPVPGLSANDLSRQSLERIHALVKQGIPTGPGLHHEPRQAPVLDDDDRSEWLRAAITERTARQIGTLGGGNHFIEVLRDETGRVWLMLHSGSRHIGKVTADHYNELAKAQMRERGVGAPNPDLNHLLIESAEGAAYLRDMSWCQRYAADNRQAMLVALAGIVEEVAGHGPDWSRAINIHHNYCSLETFTLPDSTGWQPVTKRLWVTRKGATSARAGQLGVIPGSMGTGSFIVRGLGNPLGWQSCSHGAGRLRSRAASLSTIRQEDFERAMSGIVCETVPELRDEAPQAYKDITSVMAHQADLVEPVARLLPLLNVKGYESSGGRGRIPIKVGASIKNASSATFQIIAVEVSEAKERGKHAPKLVAPGDLTMRLAPSMVGAAREIWVRTAESPHRRLLVCEVVRADEKGIELVARSVKHTEKGAH